MMKVEQFTGVTEKLGLKIFKPVSHIVLVGSGAAGTDIFSNLAVTGRVVDSDKGNDKTIIPSIKMKFLTELSTVFEGSYYLKADKSGFRCVIDIAETGALELSNSKFLEIGLTGLVAGFTYTLYGLEANENSGYVYNYSKMNMNTNQSLGTFKNNGSEYLIIPTTNFVEINFMHVNGTSKRWGVEELKAAMDKANDVVRYNESGVAVYGYAECFIVQLDGIHTYEITTDGTAYEFYSVDTKA